MEENQKHLLPSQIKKKQIAFGIILKKHFYLSGEITALEIEWIVQNDVNNMAAQSILMLTFK